MTLLKEGNFFEISTGERARLVSFSGLETYDDAVAHCQSLGMHLSPIDEPINAQMVLFLGRYWVGVTRTETSETLLDFKNDLKTVDNSFLHSGIGEYPWLTAQPDFFNNEFCVEKLNQINPKKIGLNDISCSSPSVSSAICLEFETGAPNVSPTLTPSMSPTTSTPSVAPSIAPNFRPTISPSSKPSESPSVSPSLEPTEEIIVPGTDPALVVIICMCLLTVAIFGVIARLILSKRKKQDAVLKDILSTDGLDKHHL